MQKWSEEKGKRGEQNLPRELLDLFMLLITRHSITLLSLRPYFPRPGLYNNWIISSNEHKYVTVILLLTREGPP